MHFLQEAAALYHDQINWISQQTNLPDSILHIHAGLFIFLTVSLLTGRGFDRFFPLAAVVLLAVGNECLDRIHLGNWNWPDTRMDLFNTIFWPLSIFVVVHAQRLVRPRSQLAAESPMSD